MVCIYYEAHTTWSAKLHKILSQNVKDIHCSHEVWGKNHGKQENGIGSSRKKHELKIQRGILQGYALLALLFTLAMMPINHTRTKCTCEYKLRQSFEKNNYLWYVNDVLLFSKNEKRVGNPNTDRISALLMMRRGKRNMIEGRKLLNHERAKRSEKRKLTNISEYSKRTQSHN